MEELLTDLKILIEVKNRHPHWNVKSDIRIFSKCKHRNIYLHISHFPGKELRNRIKELYKNDKVVFMK